MEAYLHFCVRKSISKRKQRFYTKSIKITISCINSFLVLFSFKLAIKIAVFLCTRIILIPSGPCCSQLAAWSYLSQKDIGEGKSASLSKLGNIQDSTDIFCFFQNICQFYRTAGIQDKYCRNLLCIKEPDILPAPVCSDNNLPRPCAYPFPHRKSCLPHRLLSGHRQYLLL